MNEKLVIWNVEKYVKEKRKREKGVWMKCIECIGRVIEWRRMKNGEGEIDMSVGVVVKKCGAKVIDCELFELFYQVLKERIQLMRIYVLEKVIHEL